jgi:hypothetical protein
MRGHSRIGVLLFWILAVVVRADGPAADPAQAMVRIKSHGASATVITTTHGKSWLLGCAHMFLDNQDRPSPALRAKRLALDGPPQPQAVFSGTRPARLLAYDHELDLSLIELDNGPFAFVPVAPRGHRPSKHLLSLGYDEMRWPVTHKAATLLGSKGNTTYTQERPWHGRSGGGLIDFGEPGVSAPGVYLIGVVQGYELTGSRRGLYVSHEAILRFLAKHLPGQTGGQTPRCLPFELCPPNG